MSENQSRGLPVENEPPPPPKTNRGSIGLGFALCWGYWIVGYLVRMTVALPHGNIATQALTTGLLFPLVLSVVLVICGKPRTGLGVFLGYISAPALAILLLLSLCVGGGLFR